MGASRRQTGAVISIDLPRRPIVRRAVVGLAVAALVVSACGSSDDTASTEDSTSESVGSAAPLEDGSGSAEGSPDGAAGAQAVQENGPITVEGDPLDPFEGSNDDPAVGATAPVVTGESFDGTPIVIGGATENPTLVVFLAHWCPHCNDEVPELIALDAAGDLPVGLDVIGVSTAVDSTRDNYPPSEWVVEKGWPWPTMADDEVVTAFNAYGGTSFPYIVLLDTDGTVLARRAGAAPAAETKVFLDAALGG
jgi:cytochrome c biogenesis protein CcmG/thiol:disulfide interchange protein DsbE